jgi:protein SCO1/2
MPAKTSSRAVPLLVAAVLLSGSLVAGVLIAGVTQKRGAAAAAPGLRADALPGDLGGSAAPAFRLRDGRGGTVDTRALKGRAYAVTFLYTRCPDVCPAIADDLRAALAESPEAAVVAVSVDPRGDTPAAVRKFAKAHRLPATFHYAVGTRKELEPVWRAYFAAPQLGDPRTSGHTASVWLVDADGRLRGMYSGGVPIDPADIAHDLRALQ